MRGLVVGREVARIFACVTVLYSLALHSATGQAAPSLALTCDLIGSCFSQGGDDNACRKFGLANGAYSILVSDDTHTITVVTPAHLSIAMQISCFSGLCKGHVGSDNVVRSLTVNRATNQASFSETYTITRKKDKLIRLYVGLCR